jgi:PIN domain nuclease of toxin-antitoxin system
MKNSLLLDTCAAIWLMENVLPKGAVDALTRAYNDGHPTYVSPITAWEIGNLARKGKLRSSLAPSRWFEGLMNSPGMALCDMPPTVLLESCELLNFPTNDPADRIIAATARGYGFTVVTRDKPLLSYAKQGYLNVLEC